MDISFRPGVGSDIAYLKNTFLHAFRNGEGAKDIPNAVYFDYHDKLLVHTLPRCSNAKGIIVAYETLPEAASFGDRVEAPIVGYIIAEPLQDALLVHMVYVKGYKKNGKEHGSQFRNQGICKALLAEAQRKLKCQDLPVLYTHRTEACWKLYEYRAWLKRIGAIFVPYLAYTLMPHGWESGKVK